MSETVPNRGPEVQAVCYTLLVSSVIACGLRIYVRTRMVKNFGFDDWAMCAALVCLLSNNIHSQLLTATPDHIHLILHKCPEWSDLRNRSSPK